MIMVKLMAKQYYFNCKTMENQLFKMSTLALNAGTCKEHSATTLGPICHYRALNIATMGTLATLKVLKGILLIVFALNIGESQAFQTTTVLLTIIQLQRTFVKLHLSLILTFSALFQLLSAIALMSATYFSKNRHMRIPQLLVRPHTS